MIPFFIYKILIKVVKLYLVDKIGFELYFIKIIFLNKNYESLSFVNKMKLRYFHHKNYFV